MSVDVGPLGSDDCFKLSRSLVYLYMLSAPGFGIGWGVNLIQHSLYLSYVVSFTDVATYL